VLIGDNALRILQITKYYYPSVSFGGPVQVTHNLSKHMVRKGHDVTVYTTDAAHIGTRERVKQNFQIIDGVKVFYFANVARPYDLFISPGILQALWQNLSSFDVVHLHEYRTFQNLAFYYSRKTNMPYALTVHGQLKIGQESRDVHILRQLYERTFGMNLLKNAGKIFALSQFEFSQLVERGVSKDKIVIIPNAIDLEDFKDPPKKGQFRKELQLDEEEIILYLGRISRLKGLEFLVRAFSLLSNSNNYRLVLAGPDHGFSNSLHRLIDSLRLNDKVLFTGTLDRKQVLGALNDAAVIVYATRQEGFPMVPLEAGIMGKPVIVSNHPSMDFVREGQFGLSVEYGKAVQLKETLERILENHDFAAELGENGRRYITKNFAFDAVAERVENEYLELINSYKAKS
jgi:glycosyltransferase involved in cell wall biosynthesis